MKSILIIASLYMLLLQGLFAQNPDSLSCGTEATPDSLMELNPWHGNNAYLYELLDSLGYAEAYDPYVLFTFKPLKS